MENRPAIPAEIKRRVLVEAGHRCAIHTCRYIEVDIHHIVPWSVCQAHDYANLIALCSNCHRRADRGDIDRKSLFLYKANLRVAHDRFTQLEMDLLFELYKKKPVLWIPGMRFALNRLFEANFIADGPDIGGVIASGFQVTSRPVVITSAGAAYVESLSTTEPEY